MNGEVIASFVRFLLTGCPPTNKRRKTNTAYGKDSRGEQTLERFRSLFFFVLCVHAFKERNALDVKEPPEIVKKIIFRGIFPAVILQDAITVRR